ncbi:unnamed protein product [Strongylus vulgaris]|uniref:Uncharacterized protein n=1 Tax=Strongylus vulgaris TaxID=40348 RepID=A0A3P7JG74_STRVU|nr:unnamed protein product [Strongylus vulgaris]
MWNLNRIGLAFYDFRARHHSYFREKLLFTFVVCDEMKLGFMTMLAGTHTYNYGVYQAIADSMMVKEKAIFKKEVLTGLCMECSSISTQNKWGTICLWIILGPVHVIVDLEGGYRMRMFLRALEESVLVKKEYHYVFANFEMEDADLASFHYSLINITGFQMFDRMDKKFV